MSDREIEELINEAMQIGIIEVVGITPSGSWLYGATKKGREIVSMQDVASALEVLTELTEE